MLNDIVADLRFALRQLRRAPGFALTAMLTLALGIGANTAMFSLMDQALLRALPVDRPQQLVTLRGTGRVWEGSTSTWAGTDEDYFSYPMYRDLRDRDTAFRDLVATVPAQVNFAHNGSNARSLDIELVSGNFFPALGIQPAAGRELTPQDDTAPDRNPVAVMSYDFWRHEMGGTADAIGSTVSVNGHPFQLVGVAAPGFRSASWGRTPGLFIPLSMDHIVNPGYSKRLTDRQSRWLNLMGRLQPQETLQQAEAQSAPLWHALRAEELKALGTRSPYFISEFLTHSRLLLRPAAGGFSYNRESYRDPLLAVTGMSALVLLIAVVNVGSLLLVRSAGRVREFSMRQALGASGSRLLAQLVTEGLLLGLGGGVLGIFLAPLAMHAVTSRLLDGNGAPLLASSIDLRVLAFTFLSAFAASMLFSVAPALQLRRRHLSLALRQVAGTHSRGMRFVRRCIVGLQIGLSLLLLVAAGLFVRTVHRLRTEAVGFRTDHLLSFSVSPGLIGYTDSRMPALRQGILDALSTLPGVREAAITTAPELANNSSTGNYSFQNYTPAPDQKLQMQFGWIDQNYLSTLQIPLLAGRNLRATDDTQHPLVALANETLARRYFGSAQRAVGQRIMRGASNHPVFDTEIVGVVADVHHQDLRSDVPPTLYLSLAQNLDPNYNLFFYVRTTNDSSLVRGRVRQQVATVNPDLAVQQLQSMDEQIDGLMQNERLIALLATAFGFLASVLAGVGLYGVLAFSTAQRTREIGVRMALGASRTSISTLVLNDVLRLTLSGVFVAMPVALLLGHLVQSQLYGVSPGDPLSLAMAVLLLFMVALAASALPVRRAAAVNPTEALRTE